VVLVETIPLMAFLQQNSALVEVGAVRPKKKLAMQHKE
jgi:hypothetical protein